MRKNCQDLNASSSLLSGVLPGTGLNKAQCIAETFTFEVLYWAQVAGSVEVEGTKHNVQQEEGGFRLFTSLFLNTGVSNKS